MVQMAILNQQADVKLEDAPFVFALANRSEVSPRG
jgi:hypothetical protein